MKILKDKMYNYEVTPPPQNWPLIASALGVINDNHIQSLQKRNRSFRYSFAAAVGTIIFFSLFTGIFNSNKKPDKTDNVQLTKNDQFSLADKITVPQSNEMKNNPAYKKYAGDTTLGDTENKKYITITGPQGQPVKISSKVASLIVSSDDQNPPNPVWHDKVKEWKNIMKANILGPSTANFLDIVDLTHALNEQK